jgi:hypothetical protein
MTGTQAPGAPPWGSSISGVGCWVHWCPGLPSSTNEKEQACTDCDHIILALAYSVGAREREREREKEREKECVCERERERETERQRREEKRREETRRERREIPFS